MIKSRIIALASSIIFAFVTIGTAAYSKNFSALINNDFIEKMKKEFDDEHTRLLNDNIPVTEDEINASAAAGDKLKDKGIQIQILEKKARAEGVAVVPSKDQILSQIDLGISVLEENIENFITNNPGKNGSESLNVRKESNVDNLNTLKQLKSDLAENRISLEDAWNRILEIRDGKK